MKLALPKKSGSSEDISVDSHIIVVIGGNGAGKTRFGSTIESNNSKITHRISAQKSLSMPEYVRTSSFGKC